MAEPRWEIPGGDTGNPLQGRASIKWGRVEEIDPVTVRVRVKFLDNEELITYWLQVIHPQTWDNKYYHMPDLLEPVLCLMDEDGEEGYILGGFYNDVTKNRCLSENETEVFWKDKSFVYQNRETSLMHIYVSEAGELLIEAPVIKIHAKELVDIRGARVQIEGLNVNISTPTDFSATVGGVPIGVMGSVDDTGDVLLIPNQVPDPLVVANLAEPFLGEGIREVENLEPFYAPSPIPNNAGGG
jgi:phage baseplate assembly protein gpV